MQVGKYLLCSYVLANHKYLGDRMTLTWHSAALQPCIYYYSLYYCVCVGEGRWSAARAVMASSLTHLVLARVAESGTILYVRINTL